MPDFDDTRETDLKRLRDGASRLPHLPPVWHGMASMNAGEHRARAANDASTTERQHEPKLEGVPVEVSVFGKRLAKMFFEPFWKLANLAYGIFTLKLGQDNPVSEPANSNHPIHSVPDKD